MRCTRPGALDVLEVVDGGRARNGVGWMLACGRYDAVFSLDDPDALVGAGLSCPACLDEATRLSVEVVGGELDARCRCTACGSTWSLALKPQQLLRLSLDPPPAADVRWSRALPPSLLPLSIEDDELRDA